MINLKTVTTAVETLLKAGLSGYQIERNPQRPQDPWMASAKTAWVGIYRGKVDYEGHAIGSNPWLARVEIVIEVQVASALSEEDCEDKLTTAEKAVLDVVNANRTLSGTVDMVAGYSVDYEINQDYQTYYQAAIITLRAQARTS